MGIRFLWMSLSLFQRVRQLFHFNFHTKKVKKRIFYERLKILVWLTNEIHKHWCSRKIFYSGLWHKKDASCPINFIPVAAASICRLRLLRAHRTLTTTAERLITPVSLLSVTENIRVIRAYMMVMVMCVDGTSLLTATAEIVLPSESLLSSIQLTYRQNACNDLWHSDKCGKACCLQQCLCACPAKHKRWSDKQDVNILIDQINRYVRIYQFSLANKKPVSVLRTVHIHSEHFLKKFFNVELFTVNFPEFAQQTVC